MGTEVGGASWAAPTSGVCEQDHQPERFHDIFFVRINFCRVFLLKSEVFQYLNRVSLH